METAHWSHAHDFTWSTEVERATAPSTAHQRLRFVVVQEAPGVWLVRGLEHDVVVEGRSIGVAVREAIKVVRAHTAFDMRHDLDAVVGVSARATELLARLWRGHAAVADAAGHHAA